MFFYSIETSSSYRTSYFFDSLLSFFNDTRRVTFALAKYRSVMGWEIVVERSYDWQSNPRVSISSSIHRCIKFNELPHVIEFLRMTSLANQTQYLRIRQEFPVLCIMIFYSIDFLITIPFSLSSYKCGNFYFRNCSKF